MSAPSVAKNPLANICIASLYQTNHAEQNDEPTRSSEFTSRRLQLLLLHSFSLSVAGGA
jgi:hypothetical protein